MTASDELQSWQATIGDAVVPGQILGGKYRLERLLGAGGMGVVLQAWHLHFEERVAVKLMLSQVGTSSNARARFEREARAALWLPSNPRRKAGRARPGCMPPPPRLEPRPSRSWQGPCSC